MSTPIPQPPAWPLIGNYLDVDPHHTSVSLWHLAEKYGPIFKLSLGGKDRYYVSTVALADELCDEKRFVKELSSALNELREGVGAGLFSARYKEPDWEIAHRVLVPAFGPIGIKNMYDETYDIATQLVAKWARIGPDEPIDVTSDYTRLTLDSIALCAMDKRFNSFYSNEMHPFVTAMTDFLVEGNLRTRRSRVESLLNRAAEKKWQQDIKTMQDVARDVIARRRANPSDKKDLLNALLHGVDPKTGEKLNDDQVMWNMITFLIAGHETTAGTLSFATYLLMRNPEVWQKAQQEVDTVVGKGPIKFEHMSKLPYIEAVLRETLRLFPTASQLSLGPIPGTKAPIVLGGQYTVPADAPFTILLPMVHKDHEVYGDDADEFKPERMYGENFTKLPKNAWKPFGNGARGCIGRPFAWQEAVLMLALILQNFNIRLQDPSYDMTIKQTLTIKPDNLFMYARLRKGIDPITLERKMYDGVVEEHKPQRTEKSKESAGGGKPITVLYGSNSGTCEGLAQSFASTASSHGHTAAVKPLDAATDHYPKDHPVVIITASYEGEPPDNAVSFIEWLKGADSSKFEGSQFAVFGCGHRDWASTYQKIPTVVDTELSGKGAKAFVERGETNVAEGIISDDFDAWSDKLWSALGADGGEAEVETLEMDITTTTRASHLRHSVQDAVVIKNNPLTTVGNEKRHMDIKLPTNMTYQAGDYIAILPVNNVPTISRILRRFSLPWDAIMTLRKGAHTTIPTEQEIPISAVLATYLELNGTPSKKNLATLAKCGGDAEKLAQHASKSIIDILEEFPDIHIPFPVYISMLTPMRIRQYSISSSPIADPTVASITYGVLKTESRLGVATNYLCNLQPGAVVQVAIKKSHAAFHLPVNDATPIIMIAAGTGIAPFHGFVQERAAKIAAGKTLAEAALFIGCRDPKEDKVYADEFAKWEAEGAVKLFYAFSRSPDDSAGCKYAQDRLWNEREYCTTLFHDGARVYICGSGRLGKGVAEVVSKMKIEREGKKGIEITREEASKWWDGLRGERYASDVFD